MRAGVTRVTALGDEETLNSWLREALALSHLTRRNCRLPTLLFRLRHSNIEAYTCDDRPVLLLRCRAADHVTFRISHFAEVLMRVTAVRSLRAVALTALALVAACGDSPTAPGIQPQISNLTDAFSYQVSSIQSFTGTYTYTWQNTGTVAKITHASDAGATGSATLVVEDATGTLGLLRGARAQRRAPDRPGRSRGRLDDPGRVHELQQYAGELRRAEAVDRSANAEHNPHGTPRRSRVHVTRLRRSDVR